MMLFIKRITQYIVDNPWTNLWMSPPYDAGSEVGKDSVIRSGSSGFFREEARDSLMKVMIIQYADAEGYGFED